MTGSESETGPFWEIDEVGVAWIRFDDPTRSLNVLAESVLRTLDAVLSEVEAQARGGAVKAVVFHSGKHRSFIAGADVAAIAGVEDPAEGLEAARFGQRLFHRVYELPVPTLAAIDGICLGGGLELALACGFRVASDSPQTKLGLPEVLLGILPAWGGTTRLPRLVGLQAALDLMLTGKRIDAKRALRRGLVDAVLPASTFRPEVERFVQQRIAGSPLRRPKRKLVTRLLDGPGARIVLSQARKRVMGQTGGHYPAPLRMLDVVGRSRGKSLTAGLDLEANAAGELIASSVSKNLIHVFNLREAARKGDGTGSETARARTVKGLGILGAGVMGGGIAQLAAFNGIRVRLKDIHHDAVASALEHANGLFQKAAKRRKLSKREASQRMELISGGLTYDGFAHADVVVEAVVERMDVKKAVLREVEAVASDDTVLASNTSSLSIDEMAQALERPEAFGGLHFFNPVHRMPLIEVVRGAATSDDTVATLYRHAVQLGKVPVVVRDGPGFLVNRILGPYLNEAGFLLQDGGSIEAIDTTAKRFGMPMGPLRLIDEVGIDIAQHAGAALHEALGERMTPSAVLVKIAESGRLGRKGGLGFYRYEGDKEKEADVDVYQVLAGTVPANRTSLDPDRITQRLVLTMINEAARILEDGIVRSAGDVDLGMIMGTGFPPFRGGLLRHADQLHPRAILAGLQELAEQVGPRFEPAPLLHELARDDRLFYVAFPARTVARTGS